MEIFFIIISKKNFRSPGHKVFTATPLVHLNESLKNISTTYHAYKHFLPAVIFRSVVKCTNESHREGENDFDLSMCEIKSFNALQYAS